MKEKLEGDREVPEIGMGESSMPNLLSFKEDNRCQNPSSTELWNGANCSMDPLPSFAMLSLCYFNSSTLFTRNCELRVSSSSPPSDFLPNVSLFTSFVLLVSLFTLSFRTEYRCRLEEDTARSPTQLRNVATLDLNKKKKLRLNIFIGIYMY